MSNKNQDVILEKYQPKKKQNLKIYEYIKNNLSEGNQEIFHSCSTFNQFITTSNKEKVKLTNSNACKNRFCPICSWRKARKDAMKISIVMEGIKTELNKEFLFLTLTTPNVPARELKNEINRFNKAFKKLFDRKKVQYSIKGYVRKLEITYNKKRDDYNPHFHVLLCVNKTYFTDKKQYINHEQWLEMWREVTELPEITQVHIKRIYGTVGDSVSEIAKYSAKDYEMATSKEVFDTFYSALKGRQLIVYAGLLKEYVQKYENGELDKYKTKDENEYFYKLLATWDRDLLKFNKEWEELSELEKEKYNNKKIIEVEVE